MGVTGTSLVMPNNPFHEEANVLGVWRWGALRNADLYEEVSPYLGLSFKGTAFVLTIRFSLFIAERTYLMALLISNKISAKMSFQSDPDFPRSINRRSRSAQIELFQSLFTDYSKYSITKKEDRPVAIESLAEALAKALKSKVSYGIFERFLHRSLLWQPAQNVLTQIPYHGNAPPSWSWMAYHGQIKYLQIGFGDVEWDKSVRFVKVEASDAATSPENDDRVLEVRVRRLRDCKTKPEGVILDKTDSEVGQLWFDTEPEVRCAIMGREIRARGENRKYYVLLVTECATLPGRGKFERVGMGLIEERFILFDGQDDTAQIL